MRLRKPRSAGTQADFQSAFGGYLNFTTTSGSITNPTAAGQLAASIAAILGNVDAQFLYFANQTDPSYAAGRWQDAIGAIYFLTRFAAQSTVLQVSCSGLAGVVIPIGATVQDGSGNIYACTAGGTIPAGGSITLPFANQVAGAITVPISVSIYQTISGWDSATLISGVEGNDVESRWAFESRRRQSVAANSSGMMASIQGAVLSLPGVLDCYCYQNDTASAVTVQGLSLPANSIYVAVEGGTSTDIANAIFSKKMPGCLYFPGNTTVSIQATNGYSVPYPTYNVVYEVPLNLQIVFEVSIVNSINVPANATTLIQNAIVGAFAGQDGGRGRGSPPNSWRAGSIRRLRRLGLGRKSSPSK